MKTLKLIIVGLIIPISHRPYCTTVNLNIGTPPAWGPDIQM
jgi:hypothetical protein